MQTNPDNKTIMVGPDYGQMIKQQTNGAIVEAFISMLFSKDTVFNLPTILKMIRNMALLLLVKTLLEDSKTYLDKFKFTNLNVFKYAYQYLKYSQINYEILLVSGKWTYNSKNMSINTLTPFLESKSIYLSQPGVYYYCYLSYLIKVTVTTTKITFSIPNIDSMIRYMENDVIHKNEEIIFGGKTSMLKAIITPGGMIKLEPMDMAYAFATDNYVKLEESIRNNFIIDSRLKFSPQPICVNFDGEPGTGKTYFGTYIASCGIFNRIVIYNLVQSTNNSFQDSVINLERQINNTSPKDRKPDEGPEMVLIILDEIDKWLASYINYKIHSLREDARAKKEIKKDEASAPIVSECFTKLTEKEEDDKRLQIRNEFLDQLYKLVDGHVLPDTRKYVIIFNTNQFDMIFKDVDARYEALKDRFQRYRFSRIGKKEIITYFVAMTHKLKEFLEDDAVDDIKKQSFKSTVTKLTTYNESVFDAIPSDIKITYRSLLKILRNNCFRIPDTINDLKYNQNFEIFPMDPVPTNNINEDKIEKV